MYSGRVGKKKKISFSLLYSAGYSRALRSGHYWASWWWEEGGGGSSADILGPSFWRVHVVKVGERRLQRYEITKFGITQWEGINRDYLLVQMRMGKLVQVHITLCAQNKTFGGIFSSVKFRSRLVLHLSSEPLTQILINTLLMNGALACRWLNLALLNPFLKAIYCLAHGISETGKFMERNPQGEAVENLSSSSR